MSDKQRRKATRRAFEEEVRCLREVLGKNPVRQTQVQGLLKSVERSFEEMHTYDRRIQDQMELEMADDNTVDKEVMECKKYQRMYDDVFAEVPEFQTAHSDDQHSRVSGSSSRTWRCGYRLPKLKMKKFSGDPKDWLYFWSQFKQIDDNDDIPNETKYHHLVQATLEGSPARKVVESFPPSSKNYPKALAYLKERFGNKDVLVEVYIRNLLGIVLSEQKNERKSLAELYDKLETQLRSLESLDITVDRYGAMLFPLVESSMPQESLRIWERTRISASQDVRRDKLQHLMSFLKIEVEGEERVKLAQQFSTSCTTSDEEKQPKSFKEKVVPTTIDLFSSAGKGKKRGCIYCDKMHPGSASDCMEAKQLSVKVKRRILMKKGACFSCLQHGHMVRDCTSKKLCQCCSKKHDVSLCPKNSDKKDDSGKPPDGKTEKSLGNQSKEGGILLQTLFVRIVHNGEARRVRALIDTGSMRSYISKKAVDVLGFPKVDQTSLSHGLFGGMETKKTRHNIHEVMITDLHGENPISMNMLEQKKICGSIPSIPVGSWLEQFASRNIHLSDLGTDGYEIHLLLGADVAGDLITGDKWKSSAGPVAIKTYLGWTVMGRLEKAATTNAESSILNLLNVNSDIDAIWNLESLGIRDPIDAESQEEKNRQAVEKFNRNVTMNDEGRYEVSLPWIAGHSTVADNRDVAKKRFRTATKTTSNLIRPVFDTSCRVKGKPALNDCLEKGDNLIEHVPAIIARFWLRRIGIISDIKKAFLQISVKIEDRRFLRFLWWEGIPEDKQKRKLKVYQHCRVVFGVNSSPFLLAATLNYHLDRQEEGKKPLAMELMRSMYVDNSCLAKDDETEADKFRDDVISMLAGGKFDLCGWVQNGSDRKWVRKLEDCELSLHLFTDASKDACIYLKSDDGSKSNDGSQEGCAQDLPYGGCSATQLLKSRRWEGPRWLYKPEVDWPICEINLDLEVEMAERRKITTMMLMTESNQWYSERLRIDTDSIDLVGATNGRLEMMNELRCQFRAQYFSKMRNYEKQKKSDEVRVRVLMLVEKENVRKSFWSIGVIMELILERGGLIRKARLQLAVGVKEFTLQRLFALEMNLYDEIGAVGMKSEVEIINNFIYSLLLY